MALQLSVQHRSFSRTFYSSSALLMLLQENCVVKHSSKDLSFSQYSCSLSFPCSFIFLNFTLSRIDVNALCNLPKKGGEHERKFVLLECSCFSQWNHWTFFKFFRCLSPDSFRFPKIKVKIPNPVPLSSSVSLSLTGQSL